MKAVGLMSGTSADGIDAALVEIQSDPIRMRLVIFDVFPYPRALQKSLITLAEGAAVSDLCHLNFYLGELLADAVIRIARRANVPLSKIALIGSHGQTVHHLPTPKRTGKWAIRSTLQIGEPSVIAERTGVTTVADFRPRDMAAGGEGAPLTPYLHFHLFSSPHVARAVVNIGGISNLTFLTAGAPLEGTRAFDAGPGNMLIDGIVRALTRGREKMDRDGKRARRGRVHAGLLGEMMRHPFIRKAPPKSTGREAFGQAMVEKMLQRGARLRLTPDDSIATATALTAAAIAEHVRRFAPAPPDELIACGGGVHNRALMENLAEALAPVPVRVSDALGYPSRAIEAMTFALLAYQTWHNQPTNLPYVTGARHPVVLGKIIPGHLPVPS